MYGNVPPTTAVEIDPSHPPKQIGLFVLKLYSISFGSYIVATADAVHPLESVIEIVYEFAVKFAAIGAVWLKESFHK